MMMINQVLNPVTNNATYDDQSPFVNCQKLVKWPILGHLRMMEHQRNKMAKLFCLFFLILCACWSLTRAATPCKPRQFSHDSIVCVCDEGHCDTIDPLTKTGRGVVQIFESTRDGKRFESRQQSFNDGFEPPAGDEWTTKLLRGLQYQDILGFGGAFSDAAALGIGSLSPKLQDDLLKTYYTDTGIQYSITRVVIGGCDFSTRGYTYNDLEYDWDLSSFSFVDEDTKYKIPQILKAKELAGSDLKLYASSWGPPAWLKNNGQLNHGGNLNEQAGSRTWKTYANYLVKFFNGYRDAGIEFWGMTTQNEVSIWDPWFPWNTCGFTADMERDFVKMHLGPLMEAEAGYTPENFTWMVWDHNREGVPSHPETILRDAEASRYVKGTGVHWYNHGADINNLDNLHNLFPDKFILATEACEAGPDGDRAALGSWSIGDAYAHDILRDLNHWVVGWTDWNLALDMEGGPNWVGNFQSAPIHVDPVANEFYKNPSFYAMGHFSKFLTPNSKRVKTEPELTDNGGFQTGAFVRPDGGVVVIAINSKDQNQRLIINDEVLGQVKLNVEPHSFNSYLYYE